MDGRDAGMEGWGVAGVKGEGQRGGRMGEKGVDGGGRMGWKDGG